MRCIFLSGKHDFCVQYLSPAIVQLEAYGILVDAGRGPQVLAIYDEVPVKFETGGEAVFLPATMKPAERRRLYQDFVAAIPGVAISRCRSP